MAKHFTKEQIDEIRRQLATDAVRDTDLPVTDSFHGEDYVAIVQDGRNKRLSCDTFRNELQNGPQGESTYEIAVRHGYTGTEEEWLAIPQSGQITLINHGTITNAPDEEDITSQDELLKLADRPSAYGLGYCILRRNKTFAEQLTETNTIYEIRYDFDLNEGSVTVPTGCVLKFVGGSINDGILVGQGTEIIYSAPFLNAAKLSGTFFTECDVYDDKVFVDDVYDTDRIKSLFCIQSPSQKVVFSKHTYNDVESIDVNRDIDVDFGGSTVNMLLDSDELPGSFLMMEASESRAISANVLGFVKIHNVNIVGNTDYEYNGTAVPGYSGRYRRAIQLFKVSDVLIENVSLTHYVVGTNNSPEGLPDAGIYRYQNKAIVVWGYDTAEIDGFVSHDCHADNLIMCVPNLNADNMAVVKNCHSYLNFTGMFAIIDGRCSVHNNIVGNFDSSAFNVFCYDSEIYSNYFVNGTRSSAIDTSEDGAYIAYNVSIYQNTCKSVPGGIAAVCGSVININNNSSHDSGSDGAAFYLDMPSTEALILGDAVNNPFTGNELYDIRVQNNYADGGELFLRTVVSSSRTAKMANKKYRDVTIRDNIFIGLSSPSSRAGGYIVLPPVQQLSIDGNYFNGDALSILSATKTSCVSMHYVIYNSTSNTVITWPSIAVHMERNRFVSEGLTGGSGSNRVLYFQDLDKKQKCDVNIEMFGNVIAAARELVSYSDVRIASQQTFGLNESGNINGVAVYDSVLLESNYVGKMKFQSGIPVWWNGTAWVDATGETV